MILALSACFVRYEPIREAARAERTGSAEAEARWGDVLDDELLVGEWKLARRRYCALRVERVGEAAGRLDTSTATYADVLALREDLAACPEAGQLAADLLGLEETVARRELAPILARDAHPYVQLVDAAPHVRHLTPGSDLWATVSGWREAWLAELDALRDTRELPVTRSFADRLIREAGRPVTLAPEAVVEAALEHAVGPYEVVGDEACADVLPHPGSSTGTRSLALHLSVSGCDETTSQGKVEVPYEVTRYRQEWQQVPVTTRYTTATTVTNVNCYTSLQAGGQVCTPVGTYTKYDTETVTTYEDRLVDVPYTVTETRMEDRFTQHTSLAWTLEARTDEGTTTIGPVRMDDREVASARPSPGPAWRRMAETAADAARTRALSWARQTHLDALATRAGTEYPDAIEALLTLDAAGRPASAAQRDALAEALGLPRTALEPQRPDLGDLAPTPLSADPITYRFPTVEQGLVRYGFSPLLYSTGFGTLDGGDFAAHTTPRSTVLHVQTEMNGSLSTGRAANGLAVHAMPVVDLHVGWRSNKAQTFQRLPLGQDENDREPRMAQGLRGGVGLFAGVRSTGLAVLVGVQPQAHFAMSGFYKNGGAHVPVAGRLEIRPVPRRPMFVNGWY
ncbi:MAG: hypothetical protein KC656_11145, partial [Myxococcales bacterium]|nr:hypothetical protein [Myxococcales bacterium]